MDAHADYADSVLVEFLAQKSPYSAWPHSVGGWLLDTSPTMNRSIHLLRLYIPFASCACTWVQRTYEDPRVEIVYVFFGEVDAVIE
jgi:hypothetical protein